MKKSSTNILHLVAFILFVVWGVSTLISVFFEPSGNAAQTIEMLLNLCAMIVMVYCATTYYLANKKSVLIAVLFWISLIVAVCAVFLPLFI